MSTHRLIWAVQWALSSINAMCDKLELKLRRTYRRSLLSKKFSKLIKPLCFIHLKTGNDILKRSSVRKAYLPQVRCQNRCWCQLKFYIHQNPSSGSKQRGNSNHRRWHFAVFFYIFFYLRRSPASGRALRLKCSWIKSVTGLQCARKPSKYKHACLFTVEDWIGCYPPLPITWYFLSRLLSCKFVKKKTIEMNFRKKVKKLNWYCLVGAIKMIGLELCKLISWKTTAFK